MSKLLKNIFFLKGLQDYHWLQQTMRSFLFEVVQQATAGGDHPNWGTGDQLLPMTAIRTNTLHECPKHDTEKVIHGRKDLEGKACGLPVSGQTHGCVGVPPSKFSLMAKQAAEGAVIYNLNADN